jgi:hypothetical protein
MKLLWSLLPPAVKAVAVVIVFFISLGWASYGAVLLIAKSEAQSIESKILLVRKTDMEHLNHRFDETHAMLKEIRKDIKEIK